jgi:WD40 repeat protein
MRLWDVATGRELRRFAGHTNGVTSVAFSPDGRYGYSADSNSLILVRDLADDKQPIRRLEGQAGEVLGLAPLSDGRHLMAGHERTLKKWDVLGERVMGSLPGPSDGDFFPRPRTRTELQSFAISPSEDLLLIGCVDGSLQLWGTGGGQHLRSLKEFVGHRGPVRSVAFSSDGKRVLSGSSDSTIRLWDVGTAQEMRRFDGHQGSVRSVAFLPGDRYAASGSGDKTVRLWALPGPETAESLRRPVGEVSRMDVGIGVVSSIAVEPSGHWLMAAGSHGELRLERIKLPAQR